MSKNRKPPLRPASRLVTIQRFEDIDFSRGSVNVKFGLVRLVRIDALASEEIDNVVFAVFVPVRGRDL